MNQLEFLNTFHDHCKNLSKAINFNYEKSFDRRFVSLYWMIIDLSGSILNLAKSDLWIGIPSLSIALFETWVDLINLDKNEDYLNHMIAEELKLTIKLMENYNKGDNEILNQIGTKILIEGKLSDYKNTYSELKEKGFRPLLIIERFEKAKLIEIYHSIYKFLRLYTYNNKFMLIKRYWNKKGKNPKEIYFTQRDSVQLGAILDETIDILGHSSITIHSHYNTGYSNPIKNMHKSFIKTGKSR